MVEPRAEVLPKIAADHACVLAHIPALAVHEMTVSREVWLYRDADWDRLESLLLERDWSSLNDRTPTAAAEIVTDTILELAGACIHKKTGPTQEVDPSLAE